MISIKDHQWLHNDIKEPNIFVNKDLDIVIGDLAESIKVEDSKDSHSIPMSKYSIS